MDTKPRLLMADEYIERLLDATRNAKKRIFMLFFVMTNDSETCEVIDEIIAAAARGVEVHVAIDMLSLYANKSFRNTKEITARLRKNKVRVRLLGMHSNFIFLDRNHSKWYVADDAVFSFGGINLNDIHLSQHVDYMLHINDAKLADMFCREQLRIESKNKHGNKVRSRSVKTDVGTVIFDGSLYNRSLIYKRAVELSKEADEILYVSQYYPTGKLNRVMRGKKVRIYANNPENAMTTDSRFMTGLSRKSSDQVNSYTRGTYLHAKFMIFAMPDGRKKALLGSHNFFKLTSIVGTREIDLETENPHIIKQLEKFFRDNIYSPVISNVAQRSREILK